MVAKLEREQLHRARRAALASAVQLHVPAHARSRSRRALSRRRVRAPRPRRSTRSPPNAGEVEVWLLGLANQLLEERLPRQPEVNFDILDETLRSEATRTDVVRSLSDPQRDFLLWELKQGCMTSVVNCLPPGERAAFVVCHVLKLPDERRREEPRHHRERVQGPAVARAQEDRRLPRAALRARQPDEPVPLPGARRHGAAQGLHPPDRPVGGEVSLRKPRAALRPLRHRRRQRRRADARYLRDLRRTRRSPIRRRISGARLVETLASA